MYEVGMRVVRIKTGQHYVISKVEGEGAETRYYLKHMNGSVDLITRDDEIKTLFRLDLESEGKKNNYTRVTTDVVIIIAILTIALCFCLVVREKRTVKESKGEGLRPEVNS